MEWAEGLSLLMACLIVVFITALHNYKHDRRLRSLASMTYKAGESPVRVWRSGSITQVPAADICVGDVVELEPGEEIPAGSLPPEALLPCRKSPTADSAPP